jgi:HAD superfamily hydrolase (TIGR01509 family)
VIPTGSGAPAREWAVLFDLDGTLVQTGELKRFRDARDWRAAYASFALSTLMPGTREMLASTALFAHVGVITMAPRTYAERLLRHHDLAVPVLVAFHDVPRAELKPHPRPILLAAELLRVPPERLIYVGDEARDVMAALAAGAHAIGYGADLSTNPAASGAAGYVTDWKGVTDAVHGIVGGSR